MKGYRFISIVKKSAAITVFIAYAFVLFFANLSFEVCADSPYNSAEVHINFCGGEDNFAENSNENDNSECKLHCHAHCHNLIGLMSKSVSDEPLSALLTDIHVSEQCNIGKMTCVIFKPPK
jgi:hypothetical protein